MPAPTAPAAQRTAVFDERGNDIDPALEHEIQPVGEEPPPALEDESDAEASAGEAASKYRIGDQEFDTIEAAHAYATAQVNTSATATEAVDAYRRGMVDAHALQNPGQNVTPAKPAFDSEKFYAKPEEFLEEFATRVRTETLQTLEQSQNQQAVAEQVWNNFSSRHPDLADFREEVDLLANAHMKELQKIVQVKGQAAGLDYLALRVKERFSKYADSMRPRRALSNGRAPAAPAGTQNVTPKPAAKKSLSMKEQLASIRAKRR